MNKAIFIFLLCLSSFFYAFRQAKTAISKPGAFLSPMPCPVEKSILFLSCYSMLNLLSVKELIRYLCHCTTNEISYHAQRWTVNQVK